MTAPDPAATLHDPIESIARALLYEGYLLWPYRRSARKNLRRFTFGVLYPRGFCDAAREGDAWRLVCECLVEGPPQTAMSVELRCLHLVRRQVLRVSAARCEPVDELDVGGERFVTWDEARERRYTVPATPLSALHERALRRELQVGPGIEEEPLRDATGRQVGSLRRAWEPLAALVEVAAEPAGAGLWRVRATVVNESRWQGAVRAEAQRRALLSAHLLLRAAPGGFLSLTDPPAAMSEVAAACRNRGVWPILVGAPGARDALLASPIVLEDYPRVATESPGDLFDGGEIDQLLTLNILALTAEEKLEMAATDPAARAILERTEALEPEALARLHGTFRSPRRGGAA